jgi:Flp pilus assembly protein TadD
VGAGPRSRAIRRLACALVALAGLVAFLPALAGDFLDWDDRHNLVDNPDYRGLGWTQLRWMFRTAVLGHYIPVTWISFGLDYVLWGMNPAGYHLTNLLLHAANAALACLLAQRLLALGLPEGTETPGLTVGAAFAALVFALHPLRAESVAWITERRDVLSGLFYLAAVLAYLRYARPAGEARGRWYGAALGLFALALLSKSMAVTLPAVLLILDIYPLRRLPWPPRHWPSPPARGVLLEKVPFALLSAAASGMALLALARSGNMTTLQSVGLPARLSISVFSLAFYLWKTAVPLDLSPLYELPPQLDLLAWPFIASGVFVLAVTGLALRLGRRFPALLAAWAAYVVILLPVLGIVQNGYQIAADRYTYLAAIPWALMLGAAAARSWSWRPPLAGGLAAAVSLALGLLAWNQAQIWKSSETLWTHALRTHPSSVAHLNLGVALLARGDPVVALRHFREALRLRPDYPDAYSNIGLVLAERGDLDEAIRHFEEARRFRPRLAEAHRNLGLAFARQGRLPEAIQHYEEALRIRPAYPEARSSLGQALESQGRLQEALQHFVEAVRVTPHSAEAHNDLGVFLARRRQVEAATLHFREAVRLKPGYAEGHNNLGIALAEQRRLAEAVQHFREAVRLKPGFSDARRNLERAEQELAREARR